MNFKPLSKPAKRRTLALVVAATAITGSIVLHGISRFISPRQPLAATETAPTIQQITALGRIEPATEVVKVSVPAALSNDRVVSLLVQRGDRVQAGQIIAVMDSRDRLQSALLEAQAQVKVVQAELAKVKAGAKSGEISAQKAEIARLQQELKGEVTTQRSTVARRQAEVNIASADYQRYWSLYQEGAIAAAELDQKRLILETAQAQLNEASAQAAQSANTLQEQTRQARATLNQIAEVRPVDVQAAQSEVDKAIASVNKANADLAEAYIRAPIAGRIIDIYAQPGETVREEGIADLGETVEMQAVTEVYQTDVAQVYTGQTAVITSDSFPDQLWGTVDQVGLQVIQQEVSSGEAGENLDRKVVEVRIQLNPEDSQRVATLTNLQVRVAIQLSPTSASNQ